MNEDAWFAAKRYGLGAGLPIAWQGWALIAAYLAAVLAAAAWSMPQRPGLFLAIVVPLSVLQLLIVARRTRGGWGSEG